MIAFHPYMKPFVMQARQQAYVELLDNGLRAIRDSAYDGKSKLCEIESIHLHNLPSLFHEANEARHHCYIGLERKEYLASLEKYGDTNYAEQRCRQYNAPWKVLMSLALGEMNQPERADSKTDNSPE